MTAKELPLWFSKTDIWQKWPWKHLTKQSTTRAGTQHSKLSTFYYLWIYLSFRIIENWFEKLVLSRKHAYIILTPLKPHFYIVKLGFTWVYIIFLLSAPDIDCGYSWEPPRQGHSNVYPYSMFKAETGKISEVFIWFFFFFFFFFLVKFAVYLNRCVFVMLHYPFFSQIMSLLHDLHFHIKHCSLLSIYSSIRNILTLNELLLPCKSSGNVNSGLSPYKWLE